jgi:hypothetical protein
MVEAHFKIPFLNRNLEPIKPHFTIFPIEYFLLSYKLAIYGQNKNEVYYG